MPLDAINMNYTETIDYLYSSLPVFQRIGAAAYKANLSNTESLDDYFQHPHREFKTIHIAGTNGKGSVSQMIYEVLRAAGYRVGLYTSPHLIDFRERIVVDDEMISEDAVVEFVDKHKGFIESLQPSFFEVTVAMAFDYFRNQKVDVAVIEVGMGGRLDSTNIITPILSVITNIDYDHTQFLGETLAEIAGEKAGIIKAEIPIVIGESNDEIEEVFLNCAELADAPIYFAQQRYQSLGHKENVFKLKSLFDNREFDILLGMSGDYQQQNLCTVLTALEIMKTEFQLTEESIKKGLSKAKVRGRWHKLSDNPLIICDSGHNTAGVKYVVRQIAEQKFDKLYIVLGMVGDKDISGVLSLLPEQAYYIFTKPDIMRALDAAELQRSASDYSLQGEAISKISSAIERAKELANKGDMIFIGGSTFVVAEALEYFDHIEEQ